METVREKEEEEEEEEKKGSPDGRMEPIRRRNSARPSEEKREKEEEEEEEEEGNWPAGPFWPSRYLPSINTMGKRSRNGPRGLGCVPLCVSVFGCRGWGGGGQGGGTTHSLLSLWLSHQLRTKWYFLHDSTTKLEEAEKKNNSRFSKKKNRFPLNPGVDVALGSLNVSLATHPKSGENRFFFVQNSSQKKGNNKNEAERNQRRDEWATAAKAKIKLQEKGRER